MTLTSEQKIEKLKKTNAALRKENRKLVQMFRMVEIIIRVQLEEGFYEELVGKPEDPDHG